jgi:hypothetical protein
MVFWTRGGESFMLQAECFQKKTLWKMRNRHFRLFRDDFAWGLYGGGLNGKYQSFVRDPSFWPALHTLQQFS